MDYVAFAEEWEAAWNSHSLDRILAHYSTNVIFRSHKAMRLVGKGELRGQAALRDYWSKALAGQPNLSFVMVDVFKGHAMMVITYRNQRLYWRPKHYVLAGLLLSKSPMAAFIST